MNITLAARRLDPARPYKPLDFGNGLVAGSLAPDGCLLALSTYHPVHGYITLNSMPPFPDSQRHNQAAVRAYRAALAQPDAPTLGMRLRDELTDQATYLLEDALPHCRFRAQALEVRVTTWAAQHNGRPLPAAAQRWSMHNPTNTAIIARCQWSGLCSLGRASYTQLTERGALPPVPNQLRVALVGGMLLIESPEAQIAACVLGLPPGPSWSYLGRCPLPIAIPSVLVILPEQTVTLTFTYGLGQTRQQAHQAARAAAHRPQRHFITALRTRQARQAADAVEPQPQQLARRALHYALDCCTLPVGETLCMLTDHQILPLSWTRDAYFVVQALADAPGIDARDLLRRHLLWLFEVAQRPAGFWGRAYLANGVPKDDVFQLDQQCYPLLELAEYATRGGDPATVTRLLQPVPSVLDALLRHQADGLPLFATAETPADDPMPLPYHFSSHVLLWHTLRQLHPLNQLWGFTHLDLAATAEAVRTAIWQHFVVERNSQRLFAYAVDARGNHHCYHDANDLPTVLAPLWGFCTTDDPVWRATLVFAFSPANHDGYAAGPFGGLGSVHTPGAWPLGDAQELLYARLIGDEQRAQAVVARLAARACWDGALPEARDPHTGAVRSRHWFAWPGALLRTVLMIATPQPVAHTSSQNF